MMNTIARSTDTGWPRISIGLTSQYRLTPRNSLPKMSRLPLMRMTDTPAVSRKVFMTHCWRLRLRSGRNRSTSRSTPHRNPMMAATIMPGKRADDLEADHLGVLEHGFLDR